MSERGVFAVDRGVWEHSMFAPEPFTEREAWLWMISAAVWKPSRVRVGRKMVDLARGQLAFSERFLAVKWKWSKSTVRRFLGRLKTEAMVSTLTDRDMTLITICNYDKYAFDGTTREPRNGPRTGPLADHSRTKEEEGKKVITKKEVDGALAPPAEKSSRKKPGRPMPDIFPMTDRHREYAAKNGFKDKSGNGFVGFTDGPAVQMFAAFKNHHIAKGSIFADWDAAWRTWVDNEVKFSAQRGGMRRVAGVPKL